MSVTTGHQPPGTPPRQAQPQEIRLAAAALDYEIGFAGRPSRTVDMLDSMGNVIGWAPDLTERFPCCDRADASRDERDRKRRVHIRTVEHVAARHRVDSFALLRLTRLVADLRDTLMDDMTVRNPGDDVLQALLPFTNDPDRLSTFVRSGVDASEAVRIHQSGDPGEYAAVQALAALRHA